MTTGERLQQIVKEHSKSLTQFCLDYKFTKATLSNYINGRNLDSEFIKALHLKLNVNPTWLLIGVGDKYLKAERQLIDRATYSNGVATYERFEDTPQDSILDGLNEEQKGAILKLIEQLRALPESKKKPKK